MHGTIQIIRFNWPQYVAACATIAVAIALWASLALPPVAACLLLLGAGLAAWWTGASIAASYYIYDRSGAYEWRWLTQYIAPPRRYVNIHAGLDESSDKLRRLFPVADARTLNIFDAKRMIESSIHRAQQVGDAPVDALALPLDDANVDTTFVLMAAHELRDPADRRGFFRELRRIVEPGGQIIVVEHLRDAANFCAFGPGFTHFISRREWHAVAHDAGLDIAGEQSATPFIRMFLLRRPS